MSLAARLPTAPPWMTLILSDVIGVSAVGNVVGVIVLWRTVTPIWSGIELTGRVAGVSTVGFGPPRIGSRAQRVNALSPEVT